MTYDTLPMSKLHCPLHPYHFVTIFYVCNDKTCVYKLITSQREGLQAIIEEEEEDNHHEQKHSDIQHICWDLFFCC